MRDLNIIREKKGFISDMDGVIYHGSTLLPGVKEFVAWLQKEKKQFLFLTNSSERSPLELRKKLQAMGLDIEENHFYTSALATAHFLKTQAPGCSAYIIGAHGLMNALYDAGITYNDVNPEYVVVGETTGYNYEMIIKATELIHKGAKLIGTNSDMTGPSDRGIIPACRALIAPIELATGKKSLFHRQTQPPHDADRPETAGGPFGRCGHDRRPDGYGRNRRCGIRHGNRPGPHRRLHPGKHQTVLLPAPLHPQRHWGSGTC